MKIILASFLLRLRKADQTSQLSQLRTTSTTCVKYQLTFLQGKKKLYLCIIVILNCVSTYTMIEIMPELKKNILKFGYGINNEHCHIHLTDSMWQLNLNYQR